MADHVRCGACKGSGRVPLTEEHAQVLDQLRGVGQATAGELCAIRRFREVGHTAMCNRLAFLERAGLATHRKRGREKVYAAAGVRDA
jgi:hypothetical protein